MIGSIRECTDHLVPLNEAHLRRILGESVDYYNRSRCHQSLEGNAPEPHQIRDSDGAVYAIPHLGGLHHEYRRAGQRARFRPARPWPQGVVSSIDWPFAPGQRPIHPLYDLRVRRNSTPESTIADRTVRVLRAHRGARGACEACGSWPPLWSTWRSIASPRLR